MELISLDPGNIHHQQVTVIQNDIDKIMNEISEDECNKLYEVLFLLFSTKI